MRFRSFFLCIGNRRFIVRIAIVPSLLASFFILPGCGSGDQHSTHSTSEDSPSRPEIGLRDRPAMDGDSVVRGPGEKRSVNEPDDSQPSVGSATDASGGPDRQAVIAHSEQLRDRGDIAESIKVLKTLLTIDPTDAEVIFRIATATAAGGDLAAGIDFLNAIPIEHSEAGLAAQGQAADWCMTLRRFPEAETRYRMILDRVPNAAPVLRQLAFLLNRQGRRQEASELVRELCREARRAALADRLE